MNPHFTLWIRNEQIEEVRISEALNEVLPCISESRFISEDVIRRTPVLDSDLSAVAGHMFLREDRRYKLTVGLILAGAYTLSMILLALLTAFAANSPKWLAAFAFAPLALVVLPIHQWERKLVGLEIVACANAVPLLWPRLLRRLPSSRNTVAWNDKRYLLAVVGIGRLIRSGEIDIQASEKVHLQAYLKAICDRTRTSLEDELVHAISQAT